MHSKNIQTAGKSLKEAKKVLILIHGRGGSAQGILRLAANLDVDNYALFAPQATNHTWYPYSFIAGNGQNEPWLSSALDTLKELVSEINDKGISSENIYFLGFSQGACLALEFTTRNATRYGGVVAFTGGLIGDKINLSNYHGDFKGTSVFIGTGNPDPHVPLERVHESVQVIKEMNASVHLEVYHNKSHNISHDEISWANKLIFDQKQR